MLFFFGMFFGFKIVLTFKKNLIMKNLKKQPTKQLEKFSNIFLQLGLVLVLFVVFISLEHKTEQKTVADENLDFKSEVYLFTPDTEVVFRKEPKIIPKQETPKQKPVFFEKIIKADNPIIETVIDIDVEDPKILDIDSFEEEKEDEEFRPEDAVSFINIQNAPIFKGCEGLSKTENKVCFDRKMKRFVQRNFDAGLANELGLSAGKYKIRTQFLIDKKGNVIDIKIRAPHKQLKKETARLIKKLPKFTPGQQQNRFVRVRYTLPIAFSVE